MANVSKTQPHFVRCLRSNSACRALALGEEFDRHLVTQQLRYGGVLQIVQASRSGFPVRMGHREFWFEIGRWVASSVTVGTAGGQSSLRSHYTASSGALQSNSNYLSSSSKPGHHQNLPNLNASNSSARLKKYNSNNNIHNTKAHKLLGTPTTGSSTALLGTPTLGSTPNILNTTSNK